MGFTCDVCSSIWTEINKTVVTVKFSGFKDLAPAKQDLCPVCIDEFSPKGTWSSLAKRVRQKSGTIDPTAIPEQEPPI